MSSDSEREACFKFCRRQEEAMAMAGAFLLRVGAVWWATVAVAFWDWSVFEGAGIAKLLGRAA